MDDARTKEIRKLLERLRTAIHASVVDSDEVNSCLAELRSGGRDAVMFLEASLVCRQDENTDQAERTFRIQVGANPGDTKYSLGSDDARWLSSIGISPTRHRSHPQHPLPPLYQPFPPVQDDG